MDASLWFRPLLKKLPDISSDMGDLFVGVDVGGTHARVIVSNANGQLVAEARGKGMGVLTHYLSVGYAIRNAMDGLNPASVKAGWVGITGHNPQTEDEVRSAWKAVGLTGTLTVSNDVVTVMPAATAREEAVVVISGTGSNVCLVKGINIVKRSGGYSLMFGDTGSAVYLGAEALKAVVLAEDGRGPRTKLRKELLQEVCKGDTRLKGEAFISALYNSIYSGKHRVSSLSKCVTRACEKGDEVAMEIINASSSGLADSIFAVGGQKLNTQKLKTIVLTGSLADPELITGRQLRNVIMQRWPSAEITWTNSSEKGALLLAFQSVGKAISPLAI